MEGVRGVVGDGVGRALPLANWVRSGPFPSEMQIGIWRGPAIGEQPRLIGRLVPL